MKLEDIILNIRVIAPEVENSLENPVESPLCPDESEGKDLDDIIYTQPYRRSDVILME